MVLVIDQRDGHFGAVAGDNPHVLAAIKIGVKPFHLSLLQHPALPGVHVQFKQGVRGGHGGVAVTQARCFRLGVITNPGDIGGIVKGDTDHFAGFTVDLPQTGEPALALFNHQPVGKEGEAFQHHLIPRRDQHFPFAFITYLGLIEAKVFPLPVGAQIEGVLEVIEAVLMILATRHKAQRLSIRQLGVQQQHFGSGGAGKKDNHIVFGGGFMQADVKGLVFLLINQFITSR